MIHVENREKIIGTLREEMIGPAPQGEEIDCSGDIVFENVEASRKPYRQKGTGEEILQREAPLTRYGAGILYPYAEPAGEADDLGPTEPIILDDVPGAEIEVTTDLSSEAVQQKLEDFREHTPTNSEDNDIDLSSANKYYPSSMGVSFLAELSPDSKLVVTACGGRYIDRPISVEGRSHTWWLRVPVQATGTFMGEDVLSSKGRVATADFSVENAGELKLSIEVFSRPRKDGNRLITVTLINRTLQKGSRDKLCLCQASFQVKIINADGTTDKILPYPDALLRTKDVEEESFALLYRDVHTFAVGHGCSADWKSVGHRANSVIAEVFPVCETPSVTPDVLGSDKNPLRLSMRSLSGLDPDRDGFQELDDLVSQYERWIAEKRALASNLPSEYADASERHLSNCELAAKRMRDGLTYLQSNRDAALAFQLANHSVLLQQLRSGREPRKASMDSQNDRLQFSDPYEPVNIEGSSGRVGYWRAFQIAFLLMNLRSTAEGRDPDRETVELIWFPTGGGKTEAYLGLTAFSLFMRRIKNREDYGVNVLMRYTLRLLTAQQFQRACALICAMEYLRKDRADTLGDRSFSIAVWLGGSVTPNNRVAALKSLRELRGSSPDAENVFLLLRCPWCRAQMGRIQSSGGRRRRSTSPLVLGYEQSGATVVFKCPDNNCDFHSGLPIYVIDEDIYENRPSLVIGTVDKFASLAWNSNARNLFGIDEHGERNYSPPGLVIQDELHLISGPLGSIVGLYETLIEELCTDRRGGEIILPKIVSSTATIRRFEAQIKGLYARENVMLFPPPGLDAGDSFFARYATNSDGSLAPGRKYVGINAPGLGSLQNTEVRTYTALLQATAGWTPEEQDPWWTLLIFFNNLRMLGNTLTLFQSQVPNHFMTRYQRTGISSRYLRAIEELTGRLRSDEVPEALAKLEVEHKSDGDNAIDVCLASNIIEVGVDVDRLSLIAVVGQPKSTSQYIQVTGRVGRKSDRPGLVVSLYSPSKPRDRSHFEKFRTYHEKLYAQVEPTSVTPFSPPALDRALHAVMVGYVLQTGDANNAESPSPFPRQLIDEFDGLISERVDIVDENEAPTVQALLSRRKRQWELWDHPNWDVGFQNQRSGSGLLRSAGGWVSPEDALISWATPNSMRSVDAEGQIQITRRYMLEQEGE